MPIFVNADFSLWWQSFMVFSSQDPFTIGLQIFLKGGWVVFLLLFTYTVYTVWLDGRQGRYASKWEFAFLALDVPKNNEQTPKAIENVFIALAGAQSNANLLDQYWHGKIQESFSFEIVSLEGYIQFLVRTPVHFRDLIEAAIYAQYPEAEITEVEDYTLPYKDIRFPNEQYDLWGAEMLFTKDYPYPIKTYPEFENKLTLSFIDPMAALLEILSRFGPGEQLWLQLIITPLKPPGWGEKAKKILKEMKGEEYKAPDTFTDKLMKPAGIVAENFSSALGELTGGFMGSSVDGEKKDADQWKMFKLTPGERLVFERIANKLSKHAFRVKFRFIYLAEKPVFQKGRGVAAVIGAIQQFNVSDANGFKPGALTKTAADYFFVKKRLAYRKNRIFRHFRTRTNYYGETTSNMLLNNEELASIWHFPVMTVKAPAMEHIASKKAVPPSRLPYHKGLSLEEKPKEKPKEKPQAPLGPSGELVGAVESAAEPVRAREAKPEPAEKEPVFKKPSPPSNLPTI